MPRHSLWICDISAQSACGGQGMIYMTSRHHVHRHHCSHIAATFLQQGRSPRDGPLTRVASFVNHIASQGIENGPRSCLKDPRLGPLSKEASLDVWSPISCKYRAMPLLQKSVVAYATVYRCRFRTRRKGQELLNKKTLRMSEGSL